MEDFFAYNGNKRFGYGLGVRTTVWDSAPTEADEFGWGGAAGATAHIDTKNQACFFYTQHLLNGSGDLFPERLMDVFYDCVQNG